MNNRNLSFKNLSHLCCDRELHFICHKSQLHNFFKVYFQADGLKKPSLKLLSSFFSFIAWKLSESLLIQKQMQITQIQIQNYITQFARFLFGIFSRSALVSLTWIVLILTLCTYDWIPYVPNLLHSVYLNKLVFFPEESRMIKHLMKMGLDIA